MTHHPDLIEPEWIARHLDERDVRIVEVDVSPAAYDDGHIPGAVLWDAYVDLRHPDYTPIDTPELEALLAKSGIEPDSTVAFYGYAGFLGYWILKAHGHAQAVVMDGPRERWADAGREWSTAASTPAAASYPLSPADPALLRTPEAVAGLAAHGDTVILDVRSELEFAGERFWPSGAPEATGRAGHIPGALSLPVDELRTSEGDFRSREELEERLATAGLRRDQRVVTYCTIGNRASQVWFALTQLLGHPDVSIYYGSWAEWGMRSDTPVATPRYADAAVH